MEDKGLPTAPLLPTNEVLDFGTSRQQLTIELYANFLRSERVT